MDLKTCFICYNNLKENFTQKLKCGHEMCLNCYFKLNVKSDEDKINCPYCRQEVGKKCDVDFKEDITIKNYNNFNSTYFGIIGDPIKKMIFITYGDDMMSEDNNEENIKAELSYDFKDLDNNSHEIILTFYKYLQHEIKNIDKLTYKYLTKIKDFKYKKRSFKICYDSKNLNANMKILD